MNKNLLSSAPENESFPLSVALIQFLNESRMAGEQPLGGSSWALDF